MSRKLRKNIIVKEEEAGSHMYKAEFRPLHVGTVNVGIQLLFTCG